MKHLRAAFLLSFLCVQVIAAPMAASPGKPRVILVNLGTTAGWQDFAYLAAVPACQSKQGAGAAIALGATGGVPREVEDYLARLKPDDVCHLGPQPLPPAPSHGKVQELSAGTAPLAAVALAEAFWSRSRHAVLCRQEDYPSALVASTLAARLRVPLLYVDDSGLSASTKATLAKLKVSETLFVGIPPAGLETQVLADASAAQLWLKARGKASSYLAVANVRDRNGTTVQRLSLAAPIYAAANDGMVLPIDVEVGWRVPFTTKPLGEALPKGIVAGVKPPKAGVIELPEGRMPFVRGCTDSEQHFRLWLDRNGDGAYDGPGEGPWQQDLLTDLFGKKRFLAFCAKFGNNADLTVTTGGPEEVVARLKPFYAAAGTPRSLCLVGFPDAIPQGLLPRGNEDMPTDLPYANLDEDLFSEIAVGRIIAESATFATLHASRCVTYAHLLDPSWAGLAGQARWEKSLGDAFANVGLNATAYHDTGDLPLLPAEPAAKSPPQPKRANSFAPESPLARVAFLSHMAHSWWHDIGQTYDMDSATLLAPTVIESGGCLTCSLDQPGFRSVVARMLRNGAISFCGQTRPGIAQQMQQRMEFWNGIFAGETLGQAHLRAQNSKAALVLETNQIRGGADYYQLQIRSLFGDPGFKPQLPAAPRTAATRVEVVGDQVRVHAPQQWWISRMRVPEDWKNWADKPLYVIRGLGAYPSCRWCAEQYDLEEIYIDAQLTTTRRVKSIEQVQKLPEPLGWKGTPVVDAHTDGSRTYHWRVRIVDFDQKTGKISSQADRIDFRVVYE